MEGIEKLRGGRAACREQRERGRLPCAPVADSLRSGGCLLALRWLTPCAPVADSLRSGGWILRSVAGSCAPWLAPALRWLAPALRWLDPRSGGWLHAQVAGSTLRWLAPCSGGWLRWPGTSRLHWTMWQGNPHKSQWRKWSYTSASPRGSRKSNQDHSQPKCQTKSKTIMHIYVYCSDFLFIYFFLSIFILRTLIVQATKPWSRYVHCGR
jgi:hypothetical protein